MLNYAAYALLCICTFLQKSVSNKKKNKIVSPLFSFVRPQNTSPLSRGCSLYSSHLIFYYRLALRVMGAAEAHPGCPQVRRGRTDNDRPFTLARTADGLRALASQISHVKARWRRSTSWLAQTSKRNCKSVAVCVRRRSVWFAVHRVSLPSVESRVVA